MTILPDLPKFSSKTEISVSEPEYTSMSKMYPVLQSQATKDFMPNRLRLVEIV